MSKPRFDFGGSPQSPTYYDKSEEYRKELELIRPQHKDNLKSLQESEASLYESQQNNDALKQEIEELKKNLIKKDEVHATDQSHIEHAEEAYLDVERQLKEEKNNREEDRKKLAKTQDEVRGLHKLVKQLDNIKGTQTAQVKGIEKRLSATQTTVKMKDDEIAELIKKLEETGNFYQGQDGRLLTTHQFVGELEKAKEEFKEVNEGLQEDILDLKMLLNAKAKEYERAHTLNEKLENQLLQLNYKYTEETIKSNHHPALTELLGSEAYRKELSQRKDSVQRSHEQGLERIRASVDESSTGEEGDLGEEGIGSGEGGIVLESLIPDFLYGPSTVPSVGTQTETSTATTSTQTSTQTGTSTATTSTQTEASVATISTQTESKTATRGTQSEPEVSLFGGFPPWLARVFGPCQLHMGILALILVLIAAFLWAWAQGSMAMEERGMWILANDRAYRLSDEIIRRQALALALMKDRGGYLTPTKVVNIYQPTLARPFVA